MIKRMITCLLLLFFGGLVQAEDLPSELMSILEQTYPQHKISFSAGPEMFVLSQDEQHILCYAEERGGRWTLVQANPTALRPGNLPEAIHPYGTPHFTVEPDSLYFRYQDGDRIRSYHAEKTNDGWMLTSLILYDGTDEYNLFFRDGELIIGATRCDQEGNPLGTFSYLSLPLPQLCDSMRPQNFDISLFPNDPHNLTVDLLQQAADQICPGYKVLDGKLSPYFLALLCENTEGERIFVGCTKPEGGSWRITESAPLPPGVTCDAARSWSDFILRFSPEGSISVAPDEEGVWRVNSVMGEDWYSVSDAGLRRNLQDAALVGSVLWERDVRYADWDAIPRAWDDAVQRLDSASWAVVSNPHPADRLHLRSEANKSSESLGKYYNGTPVRILQEKQDWVQVDIFGVQGWMMRPYLAFGEDMLTVEDASPDISLTEKCLIRGGAYLTNAPVGEITGRIFEGNIRILGVVNNRWYHVWAESSGVSGYMNCDDFSDDSIGDQG